MSDPSRPILCLGEAIVDLICEEEPAALGDATAFRPHFGGALANVAVSAARHGAPAALAGGVGDDAWGAWLHRRLEEEGVDLRWFSQVPDLQTPVAFVTFGPSREPSFSVYGDGIRAGIHAVAPALTDAIGAASALVFGSNTLVGEPERELTLRARDLAARGRAPGPVRPEPSLQPLGQHRGGMGALPRGRSGMLRGPRQPRRGARHHGAWRRRVRGRLRRGAQRARCDGRRGDHGRRRGRGPRCGSGEAAAPAVEVVSPLGAGDAFFGALAAEAARGGWTPDAVVAGLETAAAAGAAACERWEAVA